MRDAFTVLAVCAGNIHRSALAAALLERWRTWYLAPALAAEVAITSAGLIAPKGAPMGARAQRIAQAFGADGSMHRATPISDGAIAGASLILVSTVRQRDDVLRRDPTALRKTFTMREAGRIAESLEPREQPRSVVDLAAVVQSLADRRSAGDGSDDIIDPQGMEDDAYIQMVREEVPPLARLARALFGMPDVEVAAYVHTAESPEALGEELRRAGL